ncbi:MAG: HD domain-containing phosphohydrolase [Phycisphaerae bacterium]
MSRSSISLSSSGGAETAQLEFDTLLSVCRKLSELPLDELLNELLQQARALVRAEAGTVYRVVQGNRLGFSCSQNDARPELGVTPSSSDASRTALKGKTIAIDNSSLAGYAANNRESLKIDDVYNLPDDVGFHFDGKYDSATGYRTRSMLVIPLLDQTEQPVGVLQLINHVGSGKVIDAFLARDEQIAMALASMAAIGVRNAILFDELRTKNDELRMAQLETVVRLATAAEVRDDDTGQHIKRVSMYCEIIARTLGFSEEKAYNIMCASPMHDIGKLGIPDSILTKPGKLTDEERRVMQTHTTEGAKILQNSPYPLMRTAEIIAQSHHERWDGKGYPDGESGQDIPIEGRITSVADVYDALTSRRCYKPPFDTNKAFQIISEERGKQFDPQVVDAFVSAREEIEVIQETFGDSADGD